jgi:hypothetical protein
MNMRRIILALAITLFAASFAAADTIYLRDGRQVRGTLLGFISGRFVVRVEPRYRTNGPVRNPGGNPEAVELQYFRPNEVERIEIEGRSLDEMRYESNTVQVPLESNWIDTGVDLRRNEKVQITASGLILAGRARITPDGLRSTDPNSPLPSAPEGKLIGAIGDDRDSPVFEIGATKEFVADRDGRLYLTANRGSYTDARGNFTVVVRGERDLAALENGDDATRRPRNRTGVIRSRERGGGLGRQGDDRRPRTPRDLTVEVPGTSRGTDSGIDVRSGDQITFNASGTVVAGRRIGNVGPEGGRVSGFGAVVGTKPVASAGPGALIGYIRLADGQSSPAFLIGNQLVFTATGDGRLFLAINDDDYSDNSGSFSVKITYSGN